MVKESLGLWRILKDSIYKWCLFCWSNLLREVMRACQGMHFGQYDG